MLRIARETVPGGEFLQLDLLGGWDAIEGCRFDVVASAYLFHEFDLVTKIDVLDQLARCHLEHGGKLVVADIGFETRADRDRASRRWREVWDWAEHYWAADEALPRLRECGLVASYRQVSPCAGVYDIAVTAERR